MTKLLFALALVLATLAGSVGFADAHGGGTDSYGCHYETRTGLWHCH